jgi:uncharacterized membrane protein
VEGDYGNRLAARRVGTAAAAGLAAVAVGAAVGPWQVALTAGWAVAASVFLARVWWMLVHHDADATQRHATRYDDSRVAADLFLLTSCLVSLVAVGALLVKAASLGGGSEAVLTGLAVSNVVLSWTVVHTIYTLRYGHLYYTRSAGIDFGGEGEPTYRDFAYVAFTVGMTYQVSDTGLTSSAMRSTALRHALLSFLFGTAIIAMTINVVAGLLR